MGRGEGRRGEEGEKREFKREREIRISGCGVPSSYKDTNTIRLGPTSLTSFNCNYFPKGLPPNTVALEVGLRCLDLVGVHHSVRFIKLDIVTNYPGLSRTEAFTELWDFRC